MAFCENCGMQIPDDAKFCENCGAPRMQAVARQLDENVNASQAGQTHEYSYGQAEKQSTASSASAGGSAYNSGNTYNTGNNYNTTGNNYNTQYAAYSSHTADPLPRMGFAEAVQNCFSNYVNFSGRARRSEYWFFTLFVCLVQLVLGIVGNMIFGSPENGGTNILQNIFSLAIFLPSIAVFWRRMHDIGRTGLWFLLNLVPCIGQIVLLVFECTDSQPGENMYGMSPKYPA